MKEENIVKDDVYEAVKDDIICPICFGLMVIPMFCIECQNLYCQNCIEQWKKKGGGCPNRCKVFEFRKVIEKKRKISSIKFKCIKGCGAEIPFNEIEKHDKSDCFKKKKTMTLLSSEEVIKYKKNNKNKMAYFTRKKI